MLIDYTPEIRQRALQSTSPSGSGQWKVPSSPASTATASATQPQRAESNSAGYGNNSWHEVRFDAYRP